MANDFPSTSKMINLNGVDLYYEVWGDGPSILLIPGMGGDSGFYFTFAKKLAEQYRVVTYDRRGFSRSYPPPTGWTRTTMPEQAEDAAQLIKNLGIKPVIVFGSDVGALVALELVINHPQLVTKAILHDPTIYRALEKTPYYQNYWEQTNELRAIFVNFGGNGTLAKQLSIDYSHKEISSVDKMVIMRATQNNGTIFFTTEYPAYSYYLPDEKQLAEIKTPVTLLSSTTTPPMRREMNNWLAKRMNLEVVPFLGGHGPFLEYPVETAEAIKSYF
jgi:acetyltransferase/esterase